MAGQSTLVFPVVERRRASETGHRLETHRVERLAKPISVGLETSFECSDCQSSYQSLLLQLSGRRVVTSPVWQPDVLTTLVRWYYHVGIPNTARTVLLADDRPIGAPELLPSIRRRLLNMVDDEDIDGAGLRFQF
jgi:hypothetical protein